MGTVKISHFTDNLESIMLELIERLDAMLACHEGTRLSSWLLAAGQSESHLQRPRFLWNALNQLTLWGPEGNIVDYAAKQWSGLLSGYYAKRWRLFFSSLRGDFDGEAFNRRSLVEIELPFSRDVRWPPMERACESVSFRVDRVLELVQYCCNIGLLSDFCS